MRVRRGAFTGIAVLLAVIFVRLDAQSVERIAYDYTSLYEWLSPNIVKVEVDSGHGSGFLIDLRGLVATNHHVVQTTRFLAVQFPSKQLQPTGPRCPEMRKVGKECTYSMSAMP